MAGKEHAIDFRGVTKSYMLGTTRVDALRGIDLIVERGDSVSIMGPSGSGKSTLLHIMGCLDVPSTGKYYLDGIDVTTLSSDALAKVRAKKIGFVFQFFYLIPSLNAVENVMLPMVFDSIAEDARWKKAEELLDKVGLKERMYHKPSELSGGERQRVAIARALSQDPTVLLADEPTGNLDSAVGAEIIKLFHKLHHEEGITLVTVTHDPQIAHYADRVLFIKDGLITKVTKGTEHEKMVAMLKKEISFEEATGVKAGEEKKLLKVLEKKRKR
jgi:putative ABC transport system ATP-binding protein